METEIEILREDIATIVALIEAQTRLEDIDDWARDMLNKYDWLV